MLEDKKVPHTIYDTLFWGAGLQASNTLFEQADLGERRYPRPHFSVWRIDIAAWFYEPPGGYLLALLSHEVFLQHVIGGVTHPSSGHLLWETILTENACEIRRHARFAMEIPERAAYSADVMFSEHALSACTAIDGGLRVFLTGKLAGQRLP